MAKLLTDLRNGFWFAPTIIVLATVALAMLALELDAIVGDDALSRFPRLFGAGAEGARQLLSAIASSTITVAGVVFSITIVALSLTAAQYSPRALRNFMGDRANQLVLGVFVGIYVYCLLILRTIRGGDESFVPGISIVLALHVDDIEEAVKSRAMTSADERAIAGAVGQVRWMLARVSS
jgi:uncharacterized membrane protein